MAVSQSSSWVETWLVNQDFWQPDHEACDIDEIPCMNCTGRGRKMKPQLEMLSLPRLLIKNAPSEVNQDRCPAETESSLYEPADTGRPPEKPISAFSKGRAQILKERALRIERKPGSLRNSLLSLSVMTPSSSQMSLRDPSLYKSTDGEDTGSHTGLPNNSSNSHLNMFSSNVRTKKRSKLSASHRSNASNHSSCHDNHQSIPVDSHGSHHSVDSHHGSHHTVGSHHGSHHSVGSHHGSHHSVGSHHGSVRSNPSNHDSEHRHSNIVDTATGHNENTENLITDNNIRVIPGDSGDCGSTCSENSQVSMLSDRRSSVQEGHSELGGSEEIDNSQPNNQSAKEYYSKSQHKQSDEEYKRRKPFTLHEFGYVDDRVPIVIEHSVKFGGNSNRFTGFSFNHRKPEQFTLSADFPSLPVEKPKSNCDNYNSVDYPDVKTTMKDLAGFLLSDGRVPQLDKLTEANKPQFSLNLPDHTATNGEGDADPTAPIPVLFIRNLPADLNENDIDGLKEMLQYYGTVSEFNVTNTGSTSTAKVKLSSQEASTLAKECYHQNDALFPGYVLEATTEFSDID